MVVSCFFVWCIWYNFYIMWDRRAFHQRIWWHQLWIRSLALVPISSWNTENSANDQNQHTRAPILGCYGTFTCTRHQFKMVRYSFNYNILKRIGISINLAFRSYARWSGLFIKRLMCYATLLIKSWISLLTFSIDWRWIKFIRSITLQRQFYKRHEKQTFSFKSAQHIKMITFIYLFIWNQHL